jgi:sugar transferase (PEP-CTERM/EpsH1 system associated)
MRVVFLTHRLPYAPNRGDRIRAHHLLRAVAARADVTLVSLVHDRDEEARAAEMRSFVSDVITVRVTPVRSAGRAMAALMTKRPLTHALLGAPSMTAELDRIMATRRPDVILSYCSGMARYALEAPLASVPFVLDMVDHDSRKWSTLAASEWAPRRWVYSREARRLAEFEIAATRRARMTLVVNERERQSALALVPDARIVVVPNGIEHETFRPPTAPTAEPIVTFCGVLNYRPNETAAVWLAREVWPLVRARRPEARLLLVGSDPTARVRRLSVADPSVEVTGAVPDVRPYLWRSAVAAAPLATALGVQNKVLEAVAAGLPVVVTPVVMAGLPAEIAHACVVASSAPEFAASILSLLNRSPIERRALAERAELETLSWHHRLAPAVEILEAAALGN